jgi:adenylate cyclase
VLAQQGRAGEGIALLREGIGRWRGSGSEVNVPQLLALLAEACLLAGERVEGLGAADEALALVARTGQRYWQADLLRLRGDLLAIEPSAREEAVATYRQAYDTATALGQPLLRMRALLSLHGAVDAPAAPGVLESISSLYEGFREGFETRDLVEARRLLDGAK